MTPRGVRCLEHARAPEPVVPAAGILTAIAAIAAIGIAPGVAGMAAVVLGLAAGRQLADTIATRRCGAAAQAH
jgi:hypothetical protein